MCFPLFVNIEHKKFLIYGAGQIAVRRISVLLRYGADITVIAPKIHQEIEKLLQCCPRQLRVERHVYQIGEIKGECVDYVLAATNDKAVNALIYKECHQKEIPVNNASDSRQCDFRFPALVEQGNLVIGINSLDGDHKKVAQFSAKLRKLLEEKSKGLEDE